MVYINAISQYFPKNSNDNLQLIEEYTKYADDPKKGITPEDIFKQCGIKKRFVSEPNETAKDLGNRAAENLFNEYGIQREEVEYVIFVSDALEYKGPTTACIIQNDLGLRNEVGAIDVLHGCTGWVYGLSLAKALIGSGQINNVLLITADVPTKIIHPGDIELASIFSDGAAATYISNAKMEKGLNASIGNFIFGSDGKGEKSLWVERSATREPADIEWLKQHEHLPSGLVGGRLRMSSPRIFIFALRKLPLLIDQILEKNKASKEQIDIFIMHQANGTMLEFLRKRMHIPSEKFIIDLKNTGNTVSSSIPIATRRTIDTSGIVKGDRVLVAGFGIGYSWGGTVLQF